MEYLGNSRGIGRAGPVKSVEPDPVMAALVDSVNETLVTMQSSTEVLVAKAAQLSAHEKLMGTIKDPGHIKVGKGFERTVDGTVNVIGTAAFELDLSTTMQAHNVPAVFGACAHVSPDNRTTVVDEDGVLSVLSATYSREGLVQPDGETVKINDLGRLYAQKPDFFPVGTRMLFQQSAAPSGWVKEVNSAYNDAGLRLTTGNVSSGGGTAFSAALNSARATSSVSTGGTVGDTTLSVSQMPVHQHALSGASSMPVNVYEAPDEYPWRNVGSKDGMSKTAGSSASHSHSLSSSSHSHTVNVNLKYIDVIICTKE